MTLLVRGARVLTLAGGERPRRGASMRELGVLPRADVLIEGDRVSRVTGDAEIAPPPGCDVIVAGGRVLMPAFVDAHTHACWAGDRVDEWLQRLGGATYLEVLARGGGILSTVRAVRAASEAQLADGLSRRLEVMLREGTAAAEVKSGYGLTTADELKMLRAIARAAAGWPGRVVPTACIGHAIEGDEAAFVRRTIEETLPAVGAEFPGVTIDAYCERGAWSRDDTLRLVDAALSRGHPVRLHVDQFNSMGMVPAAIERGVRSVDHLEATTPGDLRALGASGVAGVLLPCTGYHVDGRYAGGRALIDAGGIVVLASNCNPGSAPTSSMPTAIAMGVRGCQLTPAEAIAASTLNGAWLLGFDDTGTIEPGARADLVLLRHADERQLAMEFGGDPIDAVIVAGRVVRRR